MPVESNYALERVLALQNAAKQGVGGFGTGLKNQAMGLAQMLGSPLQSLGQALSGAHYAVLHPKQTGQAFKQYLAQSLSSPSAAGQFVGENIGPGEIAKALSGMKVLGAGMTAYHGSPHKFDKFDLSKIGTGEGAQAYGHGLYFAEDPKVAGSYKSALSQPRKITAMEFLGKKYDLDNPIPTKVARDIDGRVEQNFFEDFYSSDKLGDSPEQNLAEAKRIIDQNLADFKENWPEFVPAAEKLRDKIYKSEAPRITSTGGGHLYNVDIPDEAIAKMLDWDAPLSEQPEAVRAALAKLPHYDSHYSGGKFYEALSGEMRGKGGQEYVSSLLRDAGIPGIKYYDGGSRGKADVRRAMKTREQDLLDGLKEAQATGNKKLITTLTRDLQELRAEPVGTRNFVVFDDSILKIISKE